MLNCIAVGLGGFLGSVYRYLAGQIPLGRDWGFPVRTLAINLIGSFLRLRIYSKKSRTGWFGISFVHVRPLW